MRTESATPYESGEGSPADILAAVRAGSKSASQARLNVLRDLQGNILKGHGRKHVRVLFGRFRVGEVGRDRGRELIGLLAQETTTALEESLWTPPRTPYERRVKATKFLSVLLTARGFDRLAPRGLKPGSAAFDEGFSRRADSVLNWDPQHMQRWSPADFAVLLAFGDDPNDTTIIDHLTGELHRLIQAYAGPPRGDSGRVLIRDGSPIEPFGYVDGISQGRILDPKEAEDTSPYMPYLPIDQILAPCPAGRAPWAFGSFMVYEKLQQDVAGFQANSEEVQTNLVGRLKDGTPLALSRRPLPRSAANAFIYDGNDDKYGCPPEAHIRLANDRMNPPSIVRRGIPYTTGAARDSYGRVDPRAESGLLFMCYTADIERHFEPLQLRLNEHDAMMKNYVTLRGGEYLFAPSISGLRRIAGI